MTHNDKHRRSDCDYHINHRCEHPLMSELQNGNKYLISKTIGVGNLLVMIVLVVGLISSWSKMEANQIHTAIAIKENVEAIQDNTESHKDILQEIRTSNRHVSQRVDRLLELELQSRRGYDQ